MSIAIPLYADVLQSKKILDAAKLMIETIPKGPKGETGAKGEKGDVGAKGDTGASLAGPKGATGDAGVKGDVGPKGDVGAKGDAGAKGDKGAKGDTGRIGLKGATGPKGENGVDCVSSDRRLKRDITDDVPGMDFVRALEPKRFRYTPEAKLDNLLHTGFVAQEIQAASKATGVPVDDMALVNTKGEYLSLNLGELHAIEIKSIQELDSRVSALENPAESE